MCVGSSFDDNKGIRMLAKRGTELGEMFETKDAEAKTTLAVIYHEITGAFLASVGGARLRLTEGSKVFLWIPGKRFDYPWGTGEVRVLVAAPAAREPDLP